MERDPRTKYFKVDVLLARTQYLDSWPAIESWARDLLGCVAGSPPLQGERDREEYDEFNGYMGPGDIAEDRTKGVKYVIGEGPARLIVWKTASYWLTGTPQQPHIDIRSRMIRMESIDWPDGQDLALTLVPEQLSVRLTLDPVVEMLTGNPIEGLEKVCWEAIMRF